MKTFLCLILIPMKLWSQTLYVDPNVDIRTIPPVQQEQLFASQMLKQVSQKGVRDEVMLYSQSFLQGKISADEFEKALWQWSQTGWSEEERWVLIDTFKKSGSELKAKSNWLCRIDFSERCSRDTLSSLKLPTRLRDYEGLILDGKGFHSSTWDNLKVSDSAFYNWVFISSKFPPFHFRGTWKELQKQDVQVQAYVQGTCDKPMIHNEVQSLQNQIYYNSDCIKPSLRPVVSEPSFYEKNKKAIWWTVGIVVGAGVFSTMKGKSIVFDKPGFM